MKSIGAILCVLAASFVFFALGEKVEVSVPVTTPAPTSKPESGADQGKEVAEVGSGSSQGEPEQQDDRKEALFILGIADGYDGTPGYEGADLKTAVIYEARKWDLDMPCESWEEVKGTKDCRLDGLKRVDHQTEGDVETKVYVVDRGCIAREVCKFQGIINTGKNPKDEAKFGSKSYFDFDVYKVSDDADQQECEDDEPAYKYKVKYNGRSEPKGAPVTTTPAPSQAKKQTGDSQQVEQEGKEQAPSKTKTSDGGDSQQVDDAEASDGKIGEEQMEGDEPQTVAPAAAEKQDGQ